MIDPTTSYVNSPKNLKVPRHATLIFGRDTVCQKNKTQIVLLRQQGQPPLCNQGLAHVRLKPWIDVAEFGSTTVWYRNDNDQGIHMITLPHLNHQPLFLLRRSLSIYTMYDILAIILWNES